MNAQDRTTKTPPKRPYTLRRRAERQAETRRRIVEAAVALHSSVGPARTSLSMVAERAGVQRHTLYAHFPDERSLLMACSALAMERAPLPDPEPWRAIGDRRARIAAGLRALYGWYGMNEQLTACVVRDAEVHPLTREVATLRRGPAMAAYAEILGAGLNATGRALLGLALGFHAWRALVRDGGLDAAAAADAMAAAIDGAG